MKFPPMREAYNSQHLENDKQEYKRELMLQLVRNEALFNSAEELCSEGEDVTYVKIVSRIADNLTDEAFK